MRIHSDINTCTPITSLYQILAWTTCWPRNMRMSACLGCEHSGWATKTTGLRFRGRGMKQQPGAAGWSLTCWLPSLVWGPLSAPSSRCVFPSFSWRTLIVRVGSVGDGHEFLSVLTVPIYIPLPFLIACSADFTLQHWMKATGIRRLLNPLSQVHTCNTHRYTYDYVLHGYIIA